MKRRILTPYRPWITSALSHQSDVTVVSNPMRHTTLHARRHVASRFTTTAKMIHNAGPIIANASALPLSEPTSCTLSANSAGYFHPPRRRPSTTNAIHQGKAAHGPNSKL